MWFWYNYKVIPQSSNDWKSENKSISEHSVLFYKTTEASQGLSWVGCNVRETGFSHPYLSPYDSFLNNWKLSKAGQFCPTELEKILLRAPAVRLLKKPKQLRFVISLQLCGVSPLLCCWSPGLCTEKVIAEAFNWFLTFTLFFSRGFGNSWIDHSPLCVVKSVSIGTLGYQLICWSYPVISSTEN